MYVRHLVAGLALAVGIVGGVATASTTAGDCDCEIIWLEEIHTDRL